MIFSMTGFGRAEATVASYQVVVELKSLNGKQLDMNARISPLVRPFEHELRTMVSQGVQRGTVDITLTVKQDGSSRPMSINTALAKQYYKDMQQIVQDLGIAEEQVLSTLMGMPDVVSSDQEILSDEVWGEIKQVITVAIAKLQDHRKIEGASLLSDLQNCIANIEQLLTAILQFEPNRVERIRTKINTSLEEWVSGANVDRNRFEQELIYYIEKIDFSEEKIRLAQHCTFFKEVLHNEELLKGKKLGFVLQEVGREINTLGSKANDADIQRLVVGMKDYLEKAKEQVLNVL